ncbi:peptidoglycan biosynthesis protein MviN/MurJ (putative lipid II flippase) [Oxalobacteraceae bacterium GrIS 2.11]
MSILDQLSNHKKALLQTGLLLLLYTLARMINSVTTLVLAYQFGASISVSQFAVFALVIALIPAVVAAAVPLIVSKELAVATDQRQALLVCRSWGVSATRGVVVGYLLLIVPLAWLLAPEPAFEAMFELAMLLLLGLPCIALAVPIVVERTILQVDKRLYVAPVYRSAALGCTFVAAALCGKTGGIYLCALGASLGAIIEFAGLLRLSSFNKYVELKSLPPIPWRAVAAVTGTNAAIVVCDLIDQALAVKLGHGMHASFVLCLSLTAFICTTLYSVTTVLATVYLPGLYTKGSSALWRGSSQLYSAIAGFTVLVYAGIALNASWLAKNLFEYGAFNPADTSKIADLLPWLSIPYLLIPAMAILVCASGLAGGTKIISWVALAYFLTRAGIAMSTYQHWGLPAIAFGAVAASSVQAAVLLFWLRSTAVEKIAVQSNVVSHA